MPVWLSTTIRIKDPETFVSYAEQARPTIEAHGGETILVGQVAGTLHGEADHQFEALFRFADRAALDAWYASDAYQALVPMRDAGAETVFKVLDEV